MYSSGPSTMWKNKVWHRYCIKVDEANDGSQGEAVQEASEEYIPHHSSSKVDDARYQLGEQAEKEPRREAEEGPEEASNEEPEEGPEEESSEELEECLEEESSEEPEEDPEEDPAEEVEVKQEQEDELGVDPELRKEPGEVLCDEVRLCAVQSILNCNSNETEKPLEEPSEVPSSKPICDFDFVEAECKSGSASDKSNEKKRTLDVTCVSAPLQYNQPWKKCKPEVPSKPKPELGFSGAELYNDSLPALTLNNDCVSKGEGTGSSGKRRRSRWEPPPGGDEVKVDDKACKRRKTRWSTDDSQIKMLGPLQLPDFMKESIVGSNEDPEIQALKAELSEINKKLQEPDLHDDELEDGRCVSREPVRLHERLVRKRQEIISKLIKKNPTFNPPPDYKPSKLFKKLYMPVKEYPEYNFVGLILGPQGNTQKRMENESGAKILLRGKGSTKTPQKSDKEDLHVYIEADNKKSLDAAVAMVEKLLIPVEGMNEHKRAQLEELAVLRRIDNSTCKECSDQGHRQYACPYLQSTFKIIVCDTCGSNSHLTVTCPLTAVSPRCSSSVQGSGLSLSSVQTKRSSGKEISDANLYVAYLPQAVDDNRLTELFSPFGKINKAKVIKDRITGNSKCYGFVKFENSADAAVATAHLNGYKMDGKLLKVRIAGLPPNTESPVLGHLPQQLGLAAATPNLTIQATWCAAPEFMMPEYQASLTDGLQLFSSSICSEYGGPNKEALGFSTPTNITSHPDLSSSGSLNISAKFSRQNSFSLSDSVTQFPGDPDHPSSHFQPYFMTPTFEPNPLIPFGRTPGSGPDPLPWLATTYHLRNT
ncbi:Branchpoint-bridging protein [Quillaja saponaria]|uniref:Branchpoint-bridging protein n=1 Tax=Quillaja saponaria TaxID=32244 RepID=A0AAD7M4T4_QUISA|nr:Branchpoint-bridging protein [Quillaja saponaria]KAJ7969979.1 Branchpoint-bridging protein [Quillaja saponaria]